MLPTAALVLSASLAGGPAAAAGSTAAPAWPALVQALDAGAEDGAVGSRPRGAGVGPVGPPVGASPAASSPASVAPSDAADATTFLPPASPRRIVKCRSTDRMPGYDANEPIVLVDGRILRVGPDEDLQDVMNEGAPLDPDDVEAIGIACWRPGAEAFGRDGIPVVRIRTKSALGRARAPLEALVAAQEALLEASGGHARAVDELFAHGLGRDADVTYSASDRAWNASAPADPGPFRCGVSSSTVEVGGGAPEITCETDSTKEIAALQELYDSGAG